MKCECVGVRCGPSARNVREREKYGFRMAATSEIMTRQSRSYCNACAKGLKAVPWKGIASGKPVASDAL